MSKYYPPTFESTHFNCPHCGVYAAQKWQVLYFQTGHFHEEVANLKISICIHCRRWSYWYKEKMLVPNDAPVPLAPIDLPESCLEDYEEARSIVSVSPRGASALMRLVLQKLMKELGESGRDIHSDIGKLVEKGLPELVQQALDFCRVVGNNAVHPGELDLNDTPEIAHALFEMLHLIVEDRITRPKKIKEMYEKLPSGALEAISKRDAKRK